MGKYKKLISIEIANVKGIDQRKFDLEILPNKPTLIVAPNGSGKSSISAAFASLKSNKLEPSNENLHKGDKNLNSSLSVTYEDVTGSHVLTADSTKNDFNGNADVFVINGQLIPKARRLKIGGTMIPVASIEVSPITLIPKVPPDRKFGYNYGAAKSALGTSGKALPNIASLLQDRTLMRRVSAVDWSRADQVKPNDAVKAFKDSIAKSSGTASEILNSVSIEALDRVKEVEHLRAIADLLRPASGISTEAGLYAAAVQIHDLYRADKKAFRAVVDRYAYLDEKAEIAADLSALRSTWKNLSPKEDPKRGLVIDFPAANQISNGERDTFWFIATLLKAWRSLKSEKCILVIDEVFDYLDEANLLACQYHLSQMIREFRSQDRQLFTLIMTHLSPSYFRGFAFRDQKVQYLNKSHSSTTKDAERVILKREDHSIESLLSQHFLHFNPIDVDLSTEFGALGLPADLDSAQKFRTYVTNHLSKYLSGAKYEPAAVFCALRLRVEEKAYLQLGSTERTAFLVLHKTVDKLDYAVAHGADVPDIMYLLSLIYNEAAHLRAHQDNDTPIRGKLENLTVRSLIQAAIQ